MKRIAVSLAACFGLLAVLTVAWAQSDTGEPVTAAAGTEKAATDSAEVEVGGYTFVGEETDTIEPPEPARVILGKDGAKVAVYAVQPRTRSVQVWRGKDGKPLRVVVAPEAEAEKFITGLIEKWKASADEDERRERQDQLRIALNSQFERRLKVHEDELKQLEEKVRKLREQVDLRREKQDDLVNFRLQQLLLEAQGLGWGTSAGTRTIRSDWPIPFSHTEEASGKLGGSGEFGQAVVPSVIGLTAQAAKDRLETSGYKVKWKRGEPAADKNSVNQVYEQVPDPGTALSTGGEVVLSVFTELPQF